MPPNSDPSSILFIPIQQKYIIFSILVMQFMSVMFSQTIFREFEYPQKIEALTLEAKYYGYYETAGSSYRYVATQPENGNVYYLLKLNQYETGFPIIGYNGQIFHLKAGKNGTLTAWKEGYFEGSGRSSPTKLGIIRGYVQGNLSGFAIDNSNKGYWAENNVLNCINLNQINDGYNSDKISWTKTLDGQITTFPIALPDSKIIVGYDPNMIGCFNGANGDLLWEQNIGFGFTSINSRYFCPGYKGYLHLLNENKIITLNTSDGSFAWEYEHTDGNYINSPRVSSRGHIIFCSNLPLSSPNTDVGGVACVNLTTQELVWEQRFDHSINNLILGDNNNIFVPVSNSPKMEITCLNSLNGEINWKFSQPTKQTFSFFLDNTGKLIANGFILENSSSGLDNGPWPTGHGGYYNRRQGSSLEIVEYTDKKPQSLSIDESWGWMKLPWVYSNRLKEWVYLHSTTTNRMIYSSKYKAWYIKDKNNNTWDLVE